MKRWLRTINLFRILQTSYFDELHEYIVISAKGTIKITSSTSSETHVLGAVSQIELACTSQRFPRSAVDNVIN